MTTESIIKWHDALLDLPDEESTVLIALDDGEVWTGFLDAGQWRYVSADPVEATVTHWAEFPNPPSPTTTPATSLTPPSGTGPVIN